MLTQADVVYMIVTDRFADGDPENNGDVFPGDPNRRHGGDLLGILRRLPYLRDLGVTTLWITPVYPNPPDAYHGYHPLDFERVDPHLCSPELGPAGDPGVVRRFVEVAHGHGFKILLDAIVCHTARGAAWLMEHPDWVNENGPDPTKWWIWGLPDLNHDRIDVNLYFAGNLQRWIAATGVDAVRIDASRHIEPAFWGVCRTLVRDANPGITVVGEVWDADPAVVAPYQNVHGLDAMFDYPLYHALVDVFARDAGFYRLARPELSDREPPGLLNRDPAYRDANRLVTFLGNHDTPRFYHLAGGDDRREEALARTRLAFTFLFTTRGIPQLYYGDEVAMEGGVPPDNRRDMAWERTAEAGTADGASELHAFLRRVIALRRASPALQYGLTVTLYVTQTVYAFARVTPGEVRLVVLNNGPAPTEVEVPLADNPRLPRAALSRLRDGTTLIDDLDPEAAPVVNGGRVRLRLPARGAAMLRSPADPTATEEMGHIRCRADRDTFPDHSRV